MKINDVIIPFHPKDAEIVSKCCESLKMIIGVKRIFLVSYNDPHISGTIYISESEIRHLITLGEIRNIVSKYGYSYFNKAGWLYQQLIKLSAINFILDLEDNYLVCDSDIIFLNNPFSDFPDNVFPFSRNFSNEFHQPYFDNISTLTGLKQFTDFSFINHHMIFNKFIIKELMECIELRFKKRWDRSIMESLEFSHPSNLSEYELYGNWIYNKHREMMRYFNLRVKDINHVPSSDEVKRLTKEFDVLCCQEWKRNKGTINYFDLLKYKCRNLFK